MPEPILLPVGRVPELDEWIIVRRLPGMTVSKPFRDLTADDLRRAAETAGIDLAVRPA